MSRGSTSLISVTAHTRISRVSTTATILVAITAAVLSWHGLTMLGEQAGFGRLSVLLPVVIDGTMLVGALHVLHASLAGLSTRWGWGMTLVGVAFSTWGNVAGAGATGVASGIVHAIPALALAASVEATMRIIRHGIARASLDSLPSSRPGALTGPPSGGGEPEPDRLAEPRPDPAPIPFPLPVAEPEQPSEPLPAAHGEASAAPVGAGSSGVGGARGESRLEQANSVEVPAPPRLRAVRDVVQRMSSEQRALAAWVRKRKAAGQSISALQATRAGMATSESSAKRALARLRADFPQALEPEFEQETGS